MLYKIQAEMRAVSYYSAAKKVSSFTEKRGVLN